MKQMKKTILALVTISMVTISGCSDSFLDKELIGVNTQNGSLDKPENVRAALNGCYAHINGGDWYQTIFPRFMMESSSDDGWGGNDYQDRPAELGVLNFTGILPSNGFVTEFYKTMHNGIRNTNFIIKGLEGVSTISPELKSQYIGEAKFLRAFFYFELVKNYGGDIILNSFDANDATLFPARSTKAEMYQTIIGDLKDAATKLPEKDQYKASDTGRATKGAALGLLAKAYLFSEDYVNAEATAQQLMSANKYQLETRYSRIFEPENINGRESLFEVNYTNAPGFSNGPLPGVISGAASVDGGWGWFGLTSDLENAFIAERDDVRRKATILKAGEEVDNELPTRIYPRHLINDKPAHTSFRYYRKFYVPLSKRVGNPWTFNHIFLRYAEVLLIHAEASAFNNKAAQALASLNLVRARAGLTPKTNLSGDVLKMAIWNERRLELAGEGTYRWDDIRRITVNGKKLIATLMGPNGTFVRYNTTLNRDPVETAGHRENINKGYYFIEGVHELWPIPKFVMDANKSVVQNPGYN